MKNDALDFGKWAGWTGGWFGTGLTSVKEDGFYGWPYTYWDNNYGPRIPENFILAEQAVHNQLEVCDLLFDVFVIE